MPTIVGVKLDNETRDRLRNLGLARDRSPHWIMKEAIARYLDREEQHEREREEDAARYQRFVDTGEHLSDAEMMRWLAGLGSRAKGPAKRPAPARAMPRKAAARARTRRR